MAKIDDVHRMLMERGSLPSALSALTQSVETRNGVSRSMFEALHTEMQTYKETFLFETVYRPIIKDLISLYDDAAEITRQTSASLTEQERRGIQNGAAIMMLEMLRQIILHIGHHSEFIVELLERLDVSMLPDSTGSKLDKKSQRAIAVEETQIPEEDQRVEKVLKRGFQYRGLVIRPEEVVIKRHRISETAKPPAAAPLGGGDLPTPIRR